LSGKAAAANAINAPESAPANGIYRAPWMLFISASAKRRGETRIFFGLSNEQWSWFEPLLQQDPSRRLTHAR
jgi:hypothetical protein